MQNKISITAISSFFLGNGVAGLLAYLGETFPALIISIVFTVIGIALGIYALFFIKDKSSHIMVTKDSILKDIKKKNLTNLAKNLLPLIVIVLVAITTISITQIYIQKQKLKATSIPTFMDLSKVDPTQLLTFSLGKNGIDSAIALGYLERTDSAGIILHGIFFHMYVTDGKFYIDTSLSGGEDSPLVEIKGNTFLVKPTSWDKNYDENALEIVNQDGDVLFQLVYESQFHIVIKGVFPYSGGFVIADNLGVRESIGYDVPHLDKIFKYPSSKYLGQRL